MIGFQNFLKWHVTQLVNSCWLNNMTIFSVINSNGSVNSFYGLEISKSWRFDNFIASRNEYHLTMSHAFSKTLSGLWSPKVDNSRTNIFIQVYDYSNDEIWKFHISPWHEESKNFLISLQLVHVGDMEATRYFWE